MDIEELEGIIFPVSKKIIDRIINNNTVFVKFTSRIPSNYKTINYKGKKLYLYESKSCKSIVGEAIIINSEYLLPKTALIKYNENFMLAEKEFYNYIKGREKKEILVLSLKDIKRYKNPLRIKKRMTMTGIYLTKSNIKEIMI
ncbi:MAG TPA: DUF365 domain-containing protein [Methanofastidiosum sp.]|jgi:hypothetical protein|nr:DUF365 domain-containing protein [Methanofastidiosum sp.]